MWKTEKDKPIRTGLDFSLTSPLVPTVDGCKVFTTFLTGAGLAKPSKPPTRDPALARFARSLENTGIVLDEEAGKEIAKAGLPQSFGSKTTARQQQQQQQQQNQVKHDEVADTTASPPSSAEVAEPQGVIAPSWQQAYDAGTGHLYYYCEATQEVQWEPPAAGFVPVPWQAGPPPPEPVRNPFLEAVAEYKASHGWPAEERGMELGTSQELARDAAVMHSTGRSHASVGLVMGEEGRVKVTLRITEQQAPALEAAKAAQLDAGHAASPSVVDSAATGTSTAHATPATAPMMKEEEASSSTPPLATMEEGATSAGSPAGNVAGSLAAAGSPGAAVAPDGAGTVEGKRKLLAAGAADDSSSAASSPGRTQEEVAGVAMGAEGTSAEPVAENGMVGVTLEDGVSGSSAQAAELAVAGVSPGFNEAEARAAEECMDVADPCAEPAGDETATSISRPSLGEAAAARKDAPDRAGAERLPRAVDVAPAESSGVSAGSVEAAPEPGVSPPGSGVPGPAAVDQKKPRARWAKRAQAGRPWWLPHYVPLAAAKYWLQRYSLFTRFDEGIVLDEESWFSVTPEVVAVHQARVVPAGCIAMDGFAGAGGNVIAMARVARSVLAVDINAARLDMLMGNAQVYGLDHKIHPVHADLFQPNPLLKADFVALSPPWGGPEYSQQDWYDVEHMGEEGMSLSHTLDICFGQIGAAGVLAFLPRNADLAQCAAAARGRPCVAERTVLNGFLKGITMYYGQAALARLEIAETLEGTREREGENQATPTPSPSDGEGAV